MSDERTPLEYAVDWMEQQAWRNKSHPISVRHGVAARQQAAANAIRDMQAQLASVIAERDRLRKATEIGFKHALYAYDARFQAFQKYPQYWKHHADDVDFIKAALSGEVQP